MINKIIDNSYVQCTLYILVLHYRCAMCIVKLCSYMHYKLHNILCSLFIICNNAQSAVHASLYLPTKAHNIMNCVKSATESDINLYDTHFFSRFFFYSYHIIIIIILIFFLYICYIIFYGAASTRRRRISIIIIHIRYIEALPRSC